MPSLFAGWNRAEANRADAENRKTYADHVRELDMRNKAKMREPLRKAWKRQALNRAAGPLTTESLAHITGTKLPSPHGKARHRMVTDDR